MIANANEIHTSIKKYLKTLDVKALMSLDTFVQLLPRMPHFQLPDCKMVHKSMEADTLHLFIQLELDSRKAGELPYTYGEMYLKVGIPKEFLK